MQRLRKNHGGYFGETIDVAAVVQASCAAAHKHGWQTENIPFTDSHQLIAFTRRANNVNNLRIYISTGIHGDEPAGPLAALHLLQANRWPANAELFLLPCLNPTGFPANTRTNAQGKDLNRDYRHFETAEIRAHIAWLEQQPSFSLAFCLHEDWEANGFYLYELNPDARPSHAQRMIDAVAPVCPIDHAEIIEERPATGGIINPNLDPASRPEWPEAFWLLKNKTRLSYTLEAPSDFPLAVRVNALVAAVQAALDAVSAQ